MYAYNILFGLENVDVAVFIVSLKVVVLETFSLVMLRRHFMPMFHFIFKSIFIWKGILENYSFYKTKVAKSVEKTCLLLLKKIKQAQDLNRIEI